MQDRETVEARRQIRKADVVVPDDHLHGDGSLTSGALMRFPDHETAIKWYNSPEYQQLIDVRNVAMDARFSLLDGLPS